MTPLPQTNCRLTVVSGGGMVADYDRPATPNQKWAGDIGAYLKESFVTRPSSSGGELSRLKQSTLTVPADIRPAVDIDPGDTVTIRQVDARNRRTLSTTREVQNVIGPNTPAGNPTTYIRIALRDAPFTPVDE